MLKYFKGMKTYKNILGVQAITKVGNHCSKERVGGRKGICHVIKMQASPVAILNREQPEKKKKITFTLKSF